MALFCAPRVVFHEIELTGFFLRERRRAIASLFSFLICAIAIEVFISRGYGDETPRLVRDLNAYGSYPAEITVAGDRVFFGSRDLEHGDELWSYDGTNAALIADLAPGTADFTPRDLVALGNRICFRSGVSGKDNELWVSDGTAAGTRRVITLSGAAAHIEGMRSDGQRVFMRVVDPLVTSGSAYQLWVSDGTAEGTRQLPVGEVSFFDNTKPVFVGTRFFFACNISREVWVTDGTADGTRKLAESGTQILQGDFVATDDGLVYFGWDELWVTDGTPGGTKQVVDLKPGAAGSFPINLVALGKSLVFFADDGSHGFEPWITDGTAAGTKLLRDIEPGSGSGIAPTAQLQLEFSSVDMYQPYSNMIGSAGGHVFFTNYSTAAGWELWSTDGTTAGTGMLADLLAGDSSSAPLDYARLGDRVVFVATGSRANGRELWISDGTASGTRLLADLAPGSDDSRPAGFALYKGGLVFRAFDGRGTKLWFTDGTPAGTRLLEDRFSNSHDGRYAQLTASGNTVFFNFSDDDGDSVYLGASDGTFTGTRRVYGPIPIGVDFSSIGLTAYSLFSLGANEVLWTPWAPTLGTELWFSDGTVAGTGLLKDFSTDTGTDASTPTGFVRFGDQVYFSAYVTASRREYFRLDVPTLAVQSASLATDSAAFGGPAYTRPFAAGDRLFVNSLTGRIPGDWQVFSSRPGETAAKLTGLDTSGLSRIARDFIVYRGFTYFTVERDTKTELWRMEANSTAASRSPVAPDGVPLAVVNDKLLVLNLGKLYSTDGTADGTRTLLTAESPFFLSADAQRAFFIDRRYSDEGALWVTDGTEGGTRRIAGFEVSGLNDTTRGVLVNGILFFRAKSAATGYELWRSDGTSSGTRRVADLWPGAGDGATNEIAATTDGRLFFVGRTPLYGYELFSLTPDSNAIQIQTQPADRTIGAGGTTSFTLAATADSTLQFQWQGSTDGGTTWSNLSNTGSYAGVTTTTLVISNATIALDGVQYRCVASSGTATATSRPAVLHVNPSGAIPTTRLVNIATRGYGSTGNRVMIGGFVVAGNTPKRVLVRAVGPSLTSRGIAATDVLADPVIEVHQGEPIIASNDNWTENTNATELASVGAQIGAAPLDAGDTKSSALLLTLQPGVYTFVATGKGGTSGVVLLEVYDAETTATGSSFVNIATRAYSTSGNGVTIGGFVISGNTAKQVLMRAVGPSLSARGIAQAEVLADPMIELHDANHGNAVIATNDNWGDNANADSIITTGARIGAAPFDASDTKSSALLTTLQPGAYTFVASGKSGTSGVVLVEVYDAD